MHKVRVLVAMPLVCLLGAGWLGGPVSWAQEPSPSNTTIRSSVEEVVLDLLVRDAKGKPVKNLETSDITVLEDGVPQKIRSFRLVAGHEARQELTASGCASGDYQDCEQPFAGGESDLPGVPESQSL